MTQCNMGVSINPWVNYNTMVIGFSRNFLNSASHCAPTAPSTTRWSQLSVTDIMLATSNLEKDENITKYSKSSNWIIYDISIPISHSQSVIYFPRTPPACVHQAQFRSLKIQIQSPIAQRPNMLTNLQELIQLLSVLVLSIME